MLCLAVFSLLLAVPADAQVNEEQKLSSLGGRALYGYTLDTDGDTVVVGTGAATGSGFVDVWVRSGALWILEAHLTAPHSNVRRHGYRVSIDGDTLAVAAPDDSFHGIADQGSVFVYTRNSGFWSLQQEIFASDPHRNHQFGNGDVQISGETMVVGARRTLDVNGRTGAVYVFTRSGTTWSQQARLIAGDAVSADNFGSSTAIDGDTVVIGSSLANAAGNDSGAAYVYTRSGTTWTQQAKLVGSDTAAADEFGTSVRIDGDTLVVGAPHNDDAGASSGSAYVFTRSGSSWSQQAKLTASDADADARYGIAVDVDVDAEAVVVGAPQADTVFGGIESGSAYLYSRRGTAWTEAATLTASDGAPIDLFGIFVAIHGTTIVVGAYLDDDPFNDNGSAYVFDGEEAGGSNQPPDITVNSPYVLEGDTVGGYDNTAGLNPVAAGVSATDPDAGDAVTITNDAPAFLPLGSTTVEWTATDLAGEEDAGIQTVTVRDTTAPNITVPGPLIEEITSPTGNVITFAVSATDIVDASPTVTCTPASATTFALGTTTVQCTATDASTNIVDSSFDVTVDDTVAPTLTVPPGINQVAASPLGDVITFVATATDAGDASPAVTCAPASGDTFGLGTTTVSCTADDLSGNVSAASTFDVTLTVGTATFAGVIAKIQGMGLNGGTDSALIAKVMAAQKSLGRGNVNAALGSLHALLNQISAQAGKKLTAAQAGDLTACVDALIAALS
jgi:hypothetical protein